MSFRAAGSASSITGTRISPCWASPKAAGRTCSRTWCRTSPLSSTPTATSPNGTRSYYLTRSQPPFFFAMVGLLVSGRPGGGLRPLSAGTEDGICVLDGGRGGLDGGRRASPRGRARRRVDPQSLLGRQRRAARRILSPRTSPWRAATPRPPQTTYRELRAAAESGWDFSSRWFADGRTLGSIDTTEIIPVDLNALMFGLENAIRAGCERSGDRDCAADFARRAAARRAAIDRTLWDPSRGVYLDYRWTLKQRIDRLSAATLYPLFTHVASDGAGGVGRRGGREGTARSPAGSSRRRSTPGSNGTRPTAGRRCSGSRLQGLNELRPRPARRDDRLPLDGQCRARLS